MKLLIIEPWFCAIGHPAQSLINLASAIGKDERVDFLVSSSGDSAFAQELMEQLRQWGVVESFAVTTPTGDSNTVRALWALCRMRLMGHRYQRIFFFDASLYRLALLWPLFSLLLPVERLGVMQLFGPSQPGGRWRNRWTRFVVGRFLKRREVKVYLRTEELAAAWSEAFETNENGQIRYLPSLEIPDAVFQQPLKKSSDTLAFGIIGQVRAGKSIEWLVPAFQNNAALGKLTVAGEFFSDRCREELSVLQGFDGFINRYMSETEMLKQAADQDYLLMLYSRWDKRMESAVLYLAARVNRPVIVYGDSWCGRMVRKFGCGVVAPVDHKETLDMLLRIPRPGSAEYAKLLIGMDAFRQAYSVKSLRGKVIQELLG